MAENDVVLINNDDVTSESIVLSEDFRFYGQVFRTAYVN